MGRVIKSVTKPFKEGFRKTVKFFDRATGGGRGLTRAIFGSDKGYRLAERQIKMQEDLAKKLEAEIPEAMARAERYGKLGLQQISQSRDIATRMAGRMGALGYSSQAITGALSGIVGETAKASIPITKATQTMMINIPSLYLRGASMAIAGSQGFVGSLEGLQQPSAFDRLLQVGAVLASANKGGMAA